MVLHSYKTSSFQLKCGFEARNYKVTRTRASKALNVMTRNLDILQTTGK